VVKREKGNKGEGRPVRRVTRKSALSKFYRANNKGKQPAPRKKGREGGKAPPFDLTVPRPTFQGERGTRLPSGGGVAKEKKSGIFAAAHGKKGGGRKPPRIIKDLWGGERNQGPRTLLASLGRERGGGPTSGIAALLGEGHSGLFCSEKKKKKKEKGTGRPDVHSRGGIDISDFQGGGKRTSFPFGMPRRGEVTKRKEEIENETTYLRPRVKKSPQTRKVCSNHIPTKRGRKNQTFPLPHFHAKNEKL